MNQPPRQSPPPDASLGQAQRDQRDFHQGADARRLHNRLRNPFIQAKERALAAHTLAALPSPPERVLEIGCGEGANLFYLAQAAPGAFVCGLDFSPAKLGLLRREVGAATPVCASAERLPFADAGFDLVLLRDLLHHVHWARPMIMAEAVRVTRPGGAVVVLESRGNTPLARLFMAANPAERGMAPNSAVFFLDLARPHGPAAIQAVEPCFLLRGVAYFLGWPRSALGRALARLLYAPIAAWEDLVARAWPHERWSYLMLTLRRPPDSEN